MIGYLEGTILNRSEERLLLLAGHVGFEVLLPGFVVDQLADKQKGDALSLYIYFHQTERQPSPILIGFTSEAEKHFFQQFITVETIGPLKAVKALNAPVHVVAAAIEANDLKALKQLKGIGPRVAQKIVATLSGRMGSHMAGPPAAAARTPAGDLLVSQVYDVLVGQLGFKSGEAKLMIDAALGSRPEIDQPEALLDAVLRAQAAGSPRAGMKQI